MNSKLLLLISFIASLLGLLLLYMLNENIEIKEINLEELNEKELKGFVKIKGEVSKVNKYDKVMFIEINQEITKEVIVFEDIDIYNEEMLEIIGEKNGERIIAKKIRVI